MAYLVLVRHGQSEWNALGKWTGQTDIGLSDQGKAEARKAAEALENITLHKAYTSELKRTHQTLHEILDHLHHAELETIAHQALSERDYGEYTAMNKWEAKEQMGEEAFIKLRRSWDHPVPGGETLKDVHARAIPYYEEHIAADLRQGKNVLISGHGNTLRALMKHLEKVADEDVHTVEIGTAEVVIYEISEDGTIVSKALHNTGNKA